VRDCKVDFHPVAGDSHICIESLEKLAGSILGILVGITIPRAYAIICANPMAPLSRPAGMCWACNASSCS